MKVLARPYKTAEKTFLHSTADKNKLLPCVEGYDYHYDDDEDDDDDDHLDLDVVAWDSWWRANRERMAGEVIEVIEIGDTDDDHVIETGCNSRMPHPGDID